MPPLLRAGSWLVLWLLAVNFLSGCQTRGLPSPTIPTVAESTLLTSLQPTATSVPPTDTPTSVVDVAGAAYSLVLESGPPTQSPTPLPDPLRFVFPTPQPEAVSAWRPPLYSVPWAPTLMDHFYFIRPIAADHLNWAAQNYRYGGEFFDDVVHTGIDIPAPEGTPVLAAGSGKIEWAGYGVYRGGYDPTDPYGLAVTIRHDYGYKGQNLYSVYGHLQQIDVLPGQHVNSGEQIGLVGTTGQVTGPHLHFEVRVGENNFLFTRNPELWIAPPMGWGVLVGRVMDSGGSLLIGQNVTITSQTTGQNVFSRSYGPDSVNPDAYYQENLVVGDLPAGKYKIRLKYIGYDFVGEIEIVPGLVRYFRFTGRYGFDYSPPELPQEDVEQSDGF